jgi:hypothetical protein
VVAVVVEDVPREFFFLEPETTRRAHCYFISGMHVKGIKEMNELRIAEKKK